ncbi:LOW QUALITY PROTEIN: hypothetical protein O9K51_03637 [Purpureocillium lavendulum]|uniref:JmjC domain-containing protein n=1 Tax=Purpureocillium lavendulum TaxID=1247861 RepID=A0AB34G2M6_9HYPO|nr:LOW QUALITY PROTEIN: hypothetical protein O9K51_03637 [Purpureocillium lavendulum]
MKTSTQTTDEPTVLRESIHVDTARMRTKYSSLVQHLLQECRNSKHSQLGNTRWDDSLVLLNRLFPSDRDIPIARIGSISPMADDIDVFYTTEDDMENLMEEGFVLHKPTVVRSPRLRERGLGLDQFLETLGDHFGGGTVDVQDPSTTHKSPVSLPVYEVIDRIRDGTDLEAGRLPINLLNLKYAGQAPPAPAFLNLRRFGVLPAISSRLEGDFNGQAIAGKRGHSTVVGSREIDLDRSLTFSLFAQRGSFTGFHVDSPDGTWVYNEWGLKLWIFATETDDASMVKFADEGDNWVPDSVVAIVLEPGDTLIMPPAKIVPHAVLTLSDSRMAGGMFMDAYRILGSIEKLLWIATHPLVSNEPIPLQLLRGWEHLRNRFYAENHRPGQIRRDLEDPARELELSMFRLMSEVMHYLQMLIFRGARRKMYFLVPCYFHEKERARLQTHEHRIRLTFDFPSLDRKSKSVGILIEHHWHMGMQDGAYDCLARNQD